MKRTNRRLALAIVLICFAATQARAAETSHLVFVTEYVRELSATENAREAAARELMAASTPNEKLSNAIYGSTRIQSELRVQINTLRNMRLDAPFNDLIPNLIEFYQQRINFHQALVDASGALLVGPKPGVDYGKITTEIPKIRALLDEIDQALFTTATPMVFATLIDQRPDSQNHLSHLIIIKAERNKLLKDISTGFGQKLEQKEQNYIVGSAALMRDFLLKDYKCADDPWQ